MANIVSRLFAAAFDLRETTEDRFFVECAECMQMPHTVLQGVSTEQEYADYQTAHNAETGHTKFQVYRMQRGGSRLFIV